MAKKNKTSKNGKESTNKISYHYRPDNMTLQEWQIALRRQAAMKEKFAISENNRKESPGYYNVVNPVTRNEYRVVYRGQDSPWNYCSCMDFKTSQLGGCKHLETVKLWIEDNHRRVCRDIPPYTSVYLSYQGERKVCLRIGTDNEEEFRRLAAPYFTSDGIMRPEASDAEEHSERLVQQGLVEEDKETGQTTLRIPVPDKESVTGILNLFGKLLTGAGK